MEQYHREHNNVFLCDAHIATACQHTIESSWETCEPITHPHYIHTHTRKSERMWRECSFQPWFYYCCWCCCDTDILYMHVRANIENGRMVKRATAPDWFVCWGVISSFLSSTNERFAFNMRSENNYVIEIGNRKREMVGFSNRNMYRFKCASTVIFHGRFMPRLYHCCFTFVIVLFRRFYRTMVIVIMAVIIGSMNTYVSVYDEVYFHLLNWETVVRFTERSLNQIIFATFKYEYYEPNTLNGFALANQSFGKSLDQITF